MINLEHAIVPLGFSPVDGPPGRYCICGELIIGTLDVPESELQDAFKTHVDVVKREVEVSEILTKMRDHVRYYQFYDRPNSWYRQHPSDANLELHWRKVQTLLEYIEEVIDDRR